MRSMYAVLMPGLLAGLVHANLESACGGPVRTITVTESASTVTETAVNVATPSVPIQNSPAYPIDSAVTAEPSAAATTTLSSTSFLTSTKFVSANPDPVPTPAQPSSVQGGPYSFAEVDGSTLWLGGKTPSSDAALVTNTLVVTLQPQPSSTETLSFTTSSGTVWSASDGTSTSWTTVSSTSYYTHYLSKALTLGAAATALSAPKLSPYVGHNGWNATFTTLQKSQSGTATSKPWGVHSKEPATWAPSVEHSKPSDAYSKAPTAWYPSTQAAASAYLPVKRRHPRQVGALVTATVDGVVVTFTNVWAGEPVTPTSVTSVQIPTSLPGLPTLPQPLPVPGYTWNSNPEPWTSATTQPQLSIIQSSVSSSGPCSSTIVSTSLSIFASIPTETVLSTADKLIPTSTAAEISSATIFLVEATPKFPNATRTSPATTTPASTCGADTGHFTIDFDDLPHFSADSGNTDIPPIFNPYRKLFFNGGFGYVPPPDDPFAPVSPPQLAVYNYHNDSSTSQSVDAGLELHGELGAGPRVHESAYWIDAYSVWIGCANGGPTDCRIDLIGYDAFNTNTAAQTLLQPPCPGLINCKLSQVTFSNEFRDLAGLQILAFVNETPVTFYMDDLSLGWSNNTCEAQFERASAQ